VRKIIKSNFSKKSFTLVDILIAFAIIGAVSIFSAVYAPIQLQKARDAVRKSHLASVKNAIEEYYEDTNCYPQAIPVCGEKIINGNLVLMDNIPCDPKSKISYTYVPEVGTCPKWYQLYANLEYTKDKIIDKIGCRNGCGPDCQFNYGAASSNQNLKTFCEAAQTTPPPASNGAKDPQPEIVQYVCAPGGKCEAYANPALSGCPDVYINDPTCQGGEICKNRKNQCHDARGKTN